MYSHFINKIKTSTFSSERWLDSVDGFLEKKQSVHNKNIGRKVHPMIVADLYVQSVVYLQWMLDKHHVAAVYVIISLVTGTYTMPYNSTIQYISYVRYGSICSDCGLPVVDIRQASCGCIVCGRCYNILSDRYVMLYS